MLPIYLHSFMSSTRCLMASFALILLYSLILFQKRRVKPHRSSIIGYRSSVIGHQSSVIGHRSKCQMFRFNRTRMSDKAKFSKRFGCNFCQMVPGLSLGQFQFLNVFYLTKWCYPVYYRCWYVWICTMMTSEIDSDWYSTIIKH